VARRIVDRDMLHLIKMWLKVPVEERDKNGKPRASGGKRSTCGTPQGGVISPLLANLYMNRFLKYWRITGRSEIFRERGEDQHQAGTERAVRFSGIQLRAASSPEEWSCVHGASPSKQSVSRLRQKVGDLLVHQNVEPWPEVRNQLNRILRGWSNYFGYGTRMMAYRAVEHYVYERVRNFLRHRHKVQSRGSSHFPDGVVFGKLGVMRLRDVHFGRLP
jgi:RNA-directed DNA polymerase